MLRIIKESHWPDQTGTEEIDNVDTQMVSANQRMRKWMQTRAGLSVPDEWEL
jgi:hypothetical protein